MKPDHVHIVGDGRGPRRVFLNGKPVSHCVYADTRNGKVRVHDSPPKIHKHRKRVIERTLHGVVEVEFL